MADRQELPNGSAARQVRAYLSHPDPSPLLALNFGFARTRVLDTALELGVFTALASGPETGPALAESLGCSVRGMGSLLDALAGMALLSQRSDGAYVLTPVSEAYLVAGTGGYLGYHLMGVLGQWDQWSSLTEVVRSGCSSHDLGGIGERARHPSMFARNLPLTLKTAAEVAERVTVPADGDVLDLAAGGGEWAIAMAAHHTQVRVVAHDEPELLEVCREQVAEFGLTARFSFVQADFEAPPFPDASFDVVILAQVGRFVGEAAVQRLIQEAARLVRSGGHVVLADVMKNVAGISPAISSMINLSLLVNTRAGELFDRSAYRSWLSRAGLEGVAELDRSPVSILISERR